MQSLNNYSTLKYIYSCNVHNIYTIRWKVSAMGDLRDKLENQSYIMSKVPVIPIDSIRHNNFQQNYTNATNAGRDGFRYEMDQLIESSEELKDWRQQARAAVRNDPTADVTAINAGGYVGTAEYLLNRARQEIAIENYMKYLSDNPDLQKEIFSNQNKMLRKNLLRDAKEMGVGNKELHKLYKELKKLDQHGTKKEKKQSKKEGKVSRAAHYLYGAGVEAIDKAKKRFKKEKKADGRDDLSEPRIETPEESQMMKQLKTSKLFREQRSRLVDEEGMAGEEESVKQRSARSNAAKKQSHSSRGRGESK